MRLRPFSARFSRLTARLALATSIAIPAAVATSGTMAGVGAQKCDALSLTSVAIERCVVPGHQPEIDAGHVVRVDNLSTRDGHWLAGHRSSHGATFAALTGMQIGDTVEYRGRMYEVVEYTTARFNSPGHVLQWTRRGVPTVVLQTSVDNVRAHLWRAETVVTDDEVVEATIAAIAAPFTNGASISDG